MRKRTLLSLMALAPVVSACGFRLRGAPSFPFASLYVQAPEGAPFTHEVLRNLATAGANLQVFTAPPASVGAEAAQRITKERREQSQMVLHLMGEHRERVVLAKTVSGQVREVELRLFARFKLVDAEGRIWIEETEMEQKREMSYNESLALAKDEEEAALYRNMYADLAQQLLRRLSLAQAPAPD